MTLPLTPIVATDDAKPRHRHNKTSSPGKTDHLRHCREKMRDTPMKTKETKRYYRFRVTRLQQDSHEKKHQERVTR